ncbi:MAG: hypothetical protein P0Y64_05705 [Candidatus Sphingomonas colombiensis]|nr:hypothetical protein [Sphingomonas sp.]WEK44303.1 MAG: hypothetical protein P0Y64_05705 [Sphingomonas sp.]
MKSINRLATRAASVPLAADDIVEFHAARLLLLMLVCGSAGRIDGLTKMAKLDFFSRYPEFFLVARAAEGEPEGSGTRPAGNAVESSMVRHHYGPWDKRYYHVLAHLEAKRLITVSKQKKSYQIALTPLGKDRAKALAELPSFAGLVDRLKQIRETFGKKTGTYLKDLIYRLFDREVGQREMGKVIRS